jgi:hypothetical protein
VKHDTIYVAVEGPPPSVTVEAPSDMPTIVLGIIGALLLAAQLWIMKRQTDLMARQEEIRRNEAVFTFSRVAHDLANELRKANVAASAPVKANFETHPRQVLRDAGRLFAPLGSKFVLAITGVALWVETYFEDVLAYNEGRLRGRNADVWYTVQRDREQIGRSLDEANLLIPSELRWKYHDGSDHPFKKLCTMPEDLAKQIMGGPTDEAAPLASPPEGEVEEGDAASPT